MMTPEDIKWMQINEGFAVTVNGRRVATCAGSADADRIAACLKALCVFNTEAIKSGRAITALQDLRK